MMLSETTSRAQSQPLPSTITTQTTPQPTIQSQSQAIHVSKLPTKGVTIKEPFVPLNKVKTVAPSTDKGKGKMIEQHEINSSDDEVDLNPIPMEFWPKDKLIAKDIEFAMKLHMKEQGISDEEQAQIDWNEEQARLIQEKEVLEALESKRKEKGGPKPKIVDFDY